MARAASIDQEQLATSQLRVDCYSWDDLSDYANIDPGIRSEFLEFFCLAPFAGAGSPLPAAYGVAPAGGVRPHATTSPSDQGGSTALDVIIDRVFERIRLRNPDAAIVEQHCFLKSFVTRVSGRNDEAVKAGKVVSRGLKVCSQLDFCQACRMSQLALNGDEPTLLIVSDQVHAMLLLSASSILVQARTG